MNTDYLISFPTPDGGLQNGADLQEFRAAIYLEGAGAASGELFLYENGTQIESLWSGTVTGSQASPTTVIGTWDATGRVAANIEARFVGTDVSGGTARLYAIEWNAALVPVAQAVGQILYNIAGRAGKGGVVRFEISALAGSQRTILYELRALATKQGIILYRVDQLGADLIMLLEGQVLIPTELGVVVSCPTDLERRIHIPTEITTDVLPA